MRIIPYVRYTILTGLPLSGVRAVLEAHTDTDNGWALSSNVEFFGTITDTEFDVMSIGGGKGLRVILRGEMKETEAGTRIEVNAKMSAGGFLPFVIFPVFGLLEFYMGITSGEWFSISWGLGAFILASGSLAFWWFREKRIETMLCGWLGSGTHIIKE